MSNPSIGSPKHPAADTRFLWKGDRRGSDLLSVLRRRSVQALWFGLLLAALLLFAWLIWLFLFAPKRTPFVVLSAAPYDWPLPPNAWAVEDVEKLAVLDGETLSLRGDDQAVFQAVDFFQRLDQQITKVNSQGNRLPLILWVSMHGVCEGDSGKIHLVPPGASPTDPDAWIDFDGVLDELEKVDPERNVLMVLDCSRMQVNWNIGMTANRFATRVKSAYHERTGSRPTNENLCLLLSAGIEEQSLTSAELAGSVFGHFFRLGLAGAADRTANAGNGDGWVDVSELHHYVDANVGWWARHSRGVSQTPMLLQVTPSEDFRLVRSLNANELDQLIRQQSTIRRPPPTVSGAQLDALWSSLDRLRQQRLYQKEPLGFRDLEHDLLWLEQLADAGKGYQSEARRLLQRLNDQTQLIESRIAQAGVEPSYTDAYSLISGKRPRLPRSLNVHSLPLADFLGTQTKASASELRAIMTGLSEQIDSSRLAAAITAIEETANTAYASEQFLKMLQRYQTPRLLASENLVSNVLKMQVAIQDLAVPRETRGTYADLRTHRWNRLLLSDVDDARREMEDRVFLQQENGLEESLVETRSGYQASVRAVELIDRATQICDRAMATTPYFAEWIAHPSRRQADQNADQINRLVLPLLDAIVELSTRLDTGAMNASATNSSDLQSVAGVAEQAKTFADEKVTPLLASLSEDWKLWQRQLMVQSEADRKETIGEIQAALSVPLADWKSRRDLRNALQRLTARVHENLDLKTDEQAGLDAEDLIAYSVRIQTWKQHPLDVIFGEESTGAKVENRTGRFLDALQEQGEALAREATMAGRWTISSDASRRTRVAAPIWFPTTKRSAISEFRDVGLQSLLLWHAQRVIDDFWGPAGEERPFYDLAASDYCDSVSEMNQWHGRPTASNANGGDGELKDLEDARSRIVASRRFLPDWIATSAGRTIQLDPTEAFESEFRVTSKADDRFKPPTGTATVAVRSQSRRIAVKKIEPADAVALPTSDETYRVTLPANLAGVAGALKAQTIFRGHEFSGPLRIEQLAGPRIDVRLPDYRHSDVTLNGPWDTLSVVFVLDCSASMGEPLVGAGELAESKLDVAKSALQDLLFNLGLRRNVRVGVGAFGHRLGWSTDEPVQPLTRPGFAGVLDPQVTPSQDVEALSPLNDFDLATAQSLVPIVGEVMPWGQSPLYLSIKQSLEEFSAADANADRHVIVITDGANYQFIPSTVTGVGPTSDDDVRRVWNTSQTPVHILGLGMDQSQDPQAVQQFTRLCVDTGGGFQALTTSTDLAKALRDLLDPGMYQLHGIREDGQPVQAAMLGKPIRVMPVPTEAEWFGVEYVGQSVAAADQSLQPSGVIEPIVLEGGEAMQLYVNEQGTEIFAFPFEDNVVAISDLVSADGMPTDHVIRVHRPDRNQDGRVTFPVSWQRRDSKSVPSAQHWRATGRPASFWIEIQPLRSDGSLAGQKYAFVDAAYLADQPVPVMALVAEQWPDTAIRAGIQVWSQPPSEASGIELVAPGNLVAPGDPATNALLSPRLDTTIEINESLERSTRVAQDISLRIDPLVSMVDADVARQRFVVEFADPEMDVTAIKLSGPPASRETLLRVVRQFDPDRRLSVHTFYYDAKRKASPSEIRVTDRRQEIEGAWQLADKVIEIAIPDSGGLLPVSGISVR